jgi:unsaturated chondroitin disaccharide hydrolase
VKEIIKQNEMWINEIWSKIERKMKIVSPRSVNKIPYTTVDGVHDDRRYQDVTWWTNGFWGGLMWLMYAATTDGMYREAAEKQELMLDKAFEEYERLHHDVGFMWHITSGANYRLTGNEKSKNRNLIAAHTLAGRFNLKGGFIRAWNLDRTGWTIIDTMLNIPLLYWASRETKDDRFKHIAMAHADMTMRDHVRPDGSVAHIVSHDPATGEVIETFGGQGFEVGSSWSRGQAWALYGFALSYIHTGKIEYLDTAKTVAHYFIACVCDDYLPKCDFRAPETPVIIDSTAGAIAACGLIEIADIVPEHEKKIYMSAALNILKAVEKSCCNWEDGEDATVLRGTQAYHRENAREIPIVYGDYYFVEALYKLKGNDILLW